ncbi:MAG: hypothetical protein ACLFU6_02405 [Candidatus Hydrogenedentota bacterium]
MARKLSKKQQQLVNQIEQNCQMVREFMNDWLMFNQLLNAYNKPDANKSELENHFLKIKSKLARQHRVLKDHLGSDFQIDGNTMNIVSGATSLEAIYSQSEVSVKKLQNEWHRAFISINETLGGLEDKKARAQRGEKVSLGITADQPIRGGGGMSPGMKKGLVVVAVVAVIVIAALAIPQVREMYLGAFNDLFG